MSLFFFWRKLMAIICNLINFIQLTLALRTCEQLYVDKRICHLYSVWFTLVSLKSCLFLQESGASVSEKRSNASKLTDAAKATAETGIEVRKNQKQQSMHKRGHKEEKNGSKHLLRHLHSPQPSAIPVSQAAPFSAKKIKSLDLYRPIISASFYSQLRYEYAQAADRGRGIKTARIGGTKKTASPSAAAKPSLNQTSSVQPTQSTTGQYNWLVSTVYFVCSHRHRGHSFQVFYLFFFSV